MVIQCNKFRVNFYNEQIKRLRNGLKKVNKTDYLCVCALSN